MDRKPRKPASDRPPRKVPFRYLKLAELLVNDIQSGHYAVGQKIPPEAELQERFDTSRHTIREALRTLKEDGYIVSRAGIGTVVRSAVPVHRYMRGVTTLRELTQTTGPTEMRVVSVSTVIADADLAKRLGGKLNRQWVEASILRFEVGSKLPMGWVRMYFAPEYASTLDLIEESQEPVHLTLERAHNVRIAEVRQKIIAVKLGGQAADLLKAAPDDVALEATRQFLDGRDHILFVSIGYYPSDRFSHDTAFRVLRD